LWRRIEKAENDKSLLFLVKPGESNLFLARSSVKSFPRHPSSSAHCPQGRLASQVSVTQSVSDLFFVSA
jgi:hypothetical protein